RHRVAEPCSGADRGSRCSPSAAHRNVGQIVMTRSTLPMHATDNKVSVLKARQSPQRRQCLMRDHSRPGLLILRSAVIVSVALGMLAAAPVPAASQQPQKVFRVGHLAGGGRTPDGAPPGPLRDALRTLGYVEGRNITYEARFAEGRGERLATFPPQPVQQPGPARPPPPPTPHPAP